MKQNTDIDPMLFSFVHVLLLYQIFHVATYNSISTIATESVLDTLMLHSPRLSKQFGNLKPRDPLFAAFI